MAEKNEVAKQPKQQKHGAVVPLSFYANKFTNLVQSDFSEHGIELDDYSKQCVMSSMSAIYNLVTSNKEAMENLNPSNLRQVVGQVASLKLNANAVPRECYFQLRSKQGADGKWHKEVELGIEGDGNDAILRQFGVNVAKVHPVWLVKEGDIFTYPKHKGMELTPPEWEEKGESQKVIRVVYPVEMMNGHVEYLIAERESVKANLLAHVRNSMMNETFGICKDRHKATDTQKAEIKAKKSEILDTLRECHTIEDMLSCETAKPFISAAWLDTPEAMIIRKMRNNAIKKYPKDFNSIASQSLLQMDDTYKQVQEEIAENANSEDFTINESEIAETIENPKVVAAAQDNGDNPFEA